MYFLKGIKVKKLFYILAIMLFTTLAIANVKSELNNNFLLISTYSIEPINPFMYGLKLESTNTLNLDSRYVDVSNFTYVGTFPYEPTNESVFFSKESNICRKDRMLFIFNRVTNKIYSLYWTNPRFNKLDFSNINECMFLQMNRN